MAAAIAAGFIAGENSALSVAFGGMACTVPNALFAWRLTRVAQRRTASYPMNFFLGEFIKLAATVALLFFVAKHYADLHWPSLLIGLGLALQANFLAFWKKS